MKNLMRSDSLMTGMVMKMTVGNVVYKHIHLYEINV